MRQYECECLTCGQKRQHAFQEPYPPFGAVFPRCCKLCARETPHTRVLTRKTASELRAAEQEDALRRSITEQCARHGFPCRFLYRSVIVTTPLADWCFDCHEAEITLYHESTVKRNFATGDPAKSHVQFRNRRMTPRDVIEYIAAHDTWRAAHPT